MFPISLVSPETFSFNYTDILIDEVNYDLKDNIELVSTTGLTLPYWITQRSNDYLCTIDTAFNPQTTIELSLKFKVFGK